MRVSNRKRRGIYVVRRKKQSEINRMKAYSDNYKKLYDHLQENGGKNNE